MRDIKFRAWDKENKHMTYNIQEMYDGYCDDTDNGLYGYMSCFTSFLYDENFIVMQYTGIKDKNGKEIYEGDVVEYKTIYEWDKKPTKRAKIVFENGMFSPPGVIMDLSRSKIIGNIWENPELLEVN